MEILQGVWEVIRSIFLNSGYAYFFTGDGVKNLVMDICNLEDEFVARKFNEILSTIEAVLEKTGFELKKLMAR